jgi:signal transduction histidine kinase
MIMKPQPILNLIIFLVISIIPNVSFSQKKIEDYNKEISKLKGKAKIEKYIEIISSQTTSTPQIGIKLGEQAIKEFTPKEFHPQRAKILYILGDLYYLTGDYTKALPLLQKSVDAFEKLNEDEDLALAYISIGRFYRKVQNDCEKALEYYTKAEKTYQKTGNFQELATVYNYLGNLTEYCEKDLNKALSYYYKTEKYYTEVRDTIGLSYSLDFISQVYGQQEKYEEALQKQKKALELRLTTKDSFAIAISYTNLGELYLMQKNETSAQKDFEKASAIASKHRFNDLNVYLLGKLSDICMIQNNPTGAYEYLKQQKELQNSMLDEEKHKQLAEMKTKYETEKKEMALEEEVIKNRNKTLLLLVLIGAIIILIIIIALVVQRRKMDRQTATISILQNLEAERTRIARDLHDNLGAELTMISSKLDMKAFRTTNEADKKDLTDIREISSNANFVLRETIWSIHKEELTIDELYRKAEEYTTRILGSKEIRIAVVATEKEAVLSPAIALHLFRIIQEAVNNASKYSNCSEVKVLISPSRVEVYDNGSGFDVKNVKAGYGLQNMQQRAKEFNGTVSIESEEGKGTSVIVEF